MSYYLVNGKEILIKKTTPYPEFAGRLVNTFHDDKYFYQQALSSSRCYVVGEMVDGKPKVYCTGTPKKPGCNDLIAEEDVSAKDSIMMIYCTECKARKKQIKRLKKMVPKLEKSKTVSSKTLKRVNEELKKYV
jgi:hypothetical protein